VGTLARKRWAEHATGKRKANLKKPINVYSGVLNLLSVGIKVRREERDISGGVLEKEA